MTNIQDIKYLKQSEIDLKKWNNSILKSINGLVYAYSWYLDVVNPDWEALVYGDYEAVMPLTNNKKYGIYYLYQPLFTQQLGVFSINKIDKSLIKSFIDAIPKKYKFIEINLNKYNNLHELKGFQIENKVTYELDLIQDYKNIAKGYKENHRRNIRKAIDNKLSVVHGLMPNEIFKLIDNFKEIPHIKSDDINKMRQLIAAAIRYQAGYLYGVYNKFNTLLSVGFFVHNNYKVSFILSISTSEGKELRAMFLLIDTFIKDFSGRNMILDFEGSNIDSIARFYKGFGANKYNYNHIKANNLPFPLNLFKT